MPFVVTNRNYGLIWDNPSKTTIEPGFNEQTVWVSEVGDRVSFFFIAGASTDEIYSGYRLLTGKLRLILPKAAYGFIQCKQRTERRMSCRPSPKASASGIYPLTLLWSTFSITPKWARWTSTPNIGPIRPA